jgi:ferrochelatase
LKEQLERCANRSQRQVLLVPIGFVCDHVEILYDLDIVAQRLATAKGLLLMRTASLNSSPRFIEALADVVKRVTFDG